MGKWAIKPQFDQAQPFSEGQAAVKYGDKWGFIDKAGTLTIRPVYKQVEPFSDSMAAVVDDYKWGYIDSKGALVITPQYHLAVRSNKVWLR